MVRRIEVPLTHTQYLAVVWSGCAAGTWPTPTATEGVAVPPPNALKNQGVARRCVATPCFHAFMRNTMDRLPQSVVLCHILPHVDPSAVPALCEAQGIRCDDLPSSVLTDALRAKHGVLDAYVRARARGASAVCAAILKAEGLIEFQLLLRAVRSHNIDALRKLLAFDGVWDIPENHWMSPDGVYWSKSPMTVAVGHGNVQAVRLLLQANAPMDKYVLMHAVHCVTTLILGRKIPREDALAVLKLLLANGVPVDRDAWDAADGDVHVRQLLWCAAA